MQVQRGYAPSTLHLPESDYPDACEMTGNTGHTPLLFKLAVEAALGRSGQRAIRQGKPPPWAQTDLPEPSIPRREIVSSTWQPQSQDPILPGENRAVGSTHMSKERGIGERQRIVAQGS